MGEILARSECFDAWISMNFGLTGMYRTVWRYAREAIDVIETPGSD